MLAGTEGTADTVFQDTMSAALDMQRLHQFAENAKMLLWFLAWLQKRDIHNWTLQHDVKFNQLKQQCYWCKQWKHQCVDHQHLGLSVIWQNWLEQGWDIQLCAHKDIICLSSKKKELKIKLQ